ncbi:MAG: sigma factor, partial [Myxococcota bacterium]
MPAALAAQPPTDEQLVAAWHGGDERAFDALYDRYAPRITGFALRMLGRREDAEEVCVETFTRLIERRWRDTGAVRAWLFTVAHRACLGRIRRRSVADLAGGELLRPRQ